MTTFITVALLVTVSAYIISRLNKKASDEPWLERPMRPYIIVDGDYKEVVHRRRSGNVLVCTLRPDIKGARRTKVAVPIDSILWLPKR